MSSNCDSPKLDAVMSFRIPEKAKKAFDELPMSIKHQAYERMRIEVARAIHEGGFDPYRILGYEE